MKIRRPQRIIRLGATSLIVIAIAASAWSQSGSDLLDVDMMFVGAHPDDDSGILATFARYILDEGFTGTVVTATGGEGGGNAIGPQAGRSLGLIRKEEERRALSLVGVDSPQFLGLTDFYFTLSAEETSHKWGESYVCDVVRHVRLARPEVIITMWPGPGTHGQHQMAARAATIAFDKASDPSFCPEQITEEFLEPFEPSKLYYGVNRDPALTVEVPTDSFSRRLNMRYADIRALGMARYRSQGFDQFLKIPVEETRPDRFMLIRSRVPVEIPETHLLAGATLPSGASPPGVKLSIEPETSTMSRGISSRVELVFANETDAPFSDLTLSLQPSDGWSVTSDSTTTFPRVPPGERVTATFGITPSATAPLDKNARLFASFQARHDGHMATGRSATWVKAVAPVQARFMPLHDVAGYREFAKSTDTEWVIETLPTRVPLVIGRVNRVLVELDNQTDAPASGRLELTLPDGITLTEPAAFDVSPHSRAEIALSLEVDDAVLPGSRHSAKVPMEISATVGATTSRDSADVYALPSLPIPRIASPPRIDGDLSDTESFAEGSISPEDLWWRRPPEDAADSSASFRLAYDEQSLYVAADVRDQTVVCNIAPDDVRAQLRSDAIGITIDPTGDSEDTSTVIQAAAFPCTTEGFGARGFRDADANQGIMEETAPGMQVASRKTAEGYTFEASIPWSVMPHQPHPGDEIGLNIIIYDGDLADARVGANISESGLGWAAFSWGGKQALPYLWPRVLLEP